MTIYGETPQQFRPRPATTTLVLFSTALTLISAWIAALVSTLLTMAAGDLRLVEEHAIPLALYPAGPHLLPGTTPVIEAARLGITPLVLLAGAAVLLTLWPVSTTLSARLSANLFARTLTAAALAQSLGTSPLEWLAGDLSADALWKPVVALGALSLLWRSEVSLHRLLGNLFSLETLPSRAVVWSSISLPQWLTWGILAALQIHTPSLWTAAVALPLTLLAACSTTPGSRWEKIDRPRMAEETALMTGLALIATIAGFLTFGVPAFSMERKAVLLATSPLARRVPLSGIAVTARSPAEQDAGSRTESREDAAQEGETTEEEPVIDIRWSDPERSSRQRSRPAENPPPPQE